MTDSSRTRTRLLLALAVLPLALAACAAGEQAQAPESSSTGSQDDQAQSAGAPSAQSSAETAGPSEEETPVLGAWEGEVRGHSYRVGVTSVVVEDDLTTLTLAVTNTGSESLGDWMIDFGGANMLAKETTLVDTANRMIYSPGVVPNTARCLCTTYNAADLEAGATTSVYTTFTGLAEGVTTVDVVLEDVPEPLANIPVTRR